MTDRRRALAASWEEARRLAEQPLSDVTPSRRDFSLYVSTDRQDLAVIARLGRTEFPPGHAWTTAELVAHARACDDAEVAALAVTAGPDGVSLADLAAIAAVSTAPVLREDWIVHPSQLYSARLHGADAAVVPLGEIDAPAVDEVVAVARSLHMAAVIEVTDEEEIERALRRAHVILGLRCTTTAGTIDVERTRRLVQRVGRAPVVVLPEVRSPAEYAALRGGCDAVMVGEALLGDTVADALRRVTGIDG